jgi:hypothetical protein
LFDGKGTKIQPTKDNKPTSVVTIINFTWDEFKATLGEFCPEREGHECQLWAKGGNFMKGGKSGKGLARIDSVVVEYNKSKLALEIKLQCSA